MNLVKLLRNLFTEKPEPVPESKYRIKFEHKKCEARAQVYEGGKWNTIKIVDLEYVAVDSAVTRCKLAIERYKLLEIDDSGVINL